MGYLRESLWNKKEGNRREILGSAPVGGDPPKRTEKGQSNGSRSSRSKEGESLGTEWATVRRHRERKAERPGGPRKRRQRGRDPPI